MDHREFVTRLPPDLRAELTATSDRAGLWHLAGPLGAVLAVGIAIAVGVPGWWVLLPVQGVLIVFLFTLEHEATHKTPFRTLWLNEWAGRLAGFLLVLPFEWFRYFHLAHHRWTNIEGRDPELDGGKPETRGAWLWHVYGMPYLASQLRLMAALLRGRAEGDYLPVGAKARMVAEARWMVMGYVLVAGSLIWSSVALWVWVLPVILGQPVLRLYLLAEHGDCPRVASMFENTRTVFTTALVRFLAWNMPYHAEHHVYPAVPFHKLPALHGLMREELRITAAGYAAFTRDYLRRRS